MKRPKMIFFDYGNTLVHEPSWSIVRGLTALWPYLAENPKGFTPETFEPIAYETIKKSWECVKLGYEIPERAFMHAAFDPNGLVFGIPDEEIEYVYFMASIPPVLIPGVAEALAFCRREGIRTAVVSNLSYDAKVLERRLKTLIPDHSFEFVLASSNLFFRKPHPAMMEAALAKAKLDPADVWFVGDNYHADIAPSHALGMVPVWFEYEMKSFYHVEPFHDEPPFPCLRAETMDALIRTVEQTDIPR